MEELVVALLRNIILYQILYAIHVIQHAQFVQDQVQINAQDAHQPITDNSTQPHLHANVKPHFMHPTMSWFVLNNHHHLVQLFTHTTQQQGIVIKFVEMGNCLNWNAMMGIQTQEMDVINIVK